jgi:uncharacterized cupredoxin-like copper-binding protein
MRTRSVIAALLGALALSGAGLGPAAASAGAARGYPARLLVYAQEWSLSPSRTTVPAGRVTVQLWNRGMDPHDLRIRHVTAGGQMYGRTQAVKVTLPGAVSTVTWTLAPGRYELYCSLPGHLAMGMHVQLRVTRSGQAASASIAS